MKEGLFIVLITKSEMEYLVSKGYRWKKDIHRTYSRYHKYYATELEKLTEDLRVLRESKIRK